LILAQGCAGLELPFSFVPLNLRGISVIEWSMPNDLALLAQGSPSGNPAVDSVAFTLEFLTLTVRG
jgi:hypothetical protein